MAKVSETNISSTQFSPHLAIQHHCDQCHYFGGWLPITVGDEVRHDVHSACLKPKLSRVRVVASPENGCAFWIASPDGGTS